MDFLGFASLENTCIESLALNFDSFLPIWYKDENVVLKNCLQRNFSDALFEKLEGPLRKGHASFLINPYLRALYLDRFSMTDIDEVIKILKSQGEGILDVQLWKIREEEHYSETTLLQLAKSLPISLKSLQLVGIQCSSHVLQVVTNRCLNLEQLVLRGCVSVTDDVLEAALANGQQPINHTLKILDLRDTFVGGNAIVSILNSCPNLREILHYNIELALNFIYARHVENRNSKIFPKQFSGKYNLEKINLAAVALEAVHLLCPNIKCLSVYDMTSQRHVDLCKDFARVEELVFHFLKSALLSSLFQTRGFNLKSVIISGNIIVPVDSLVRFCPNIEYLVLSNVKCERLGINPARLSLQKLQGLSITFVDFDVEIQHISMIFACAPNLEALHLDNVSGGDMHDFINMMATLRLTSLQVFEIPFSHTNLQLVVKIINAAPHLKSVLLISITNDSQNNEIRRQLGSEIRIIHQDDVTF